LGRACDIPETGRAPSQHAWPGDTGRLPVRLGAIGILPMRHGLVLRDN